MQNDVHIMAHTLNVYFTHNTSRAVLTVPRIYLVTDCRMDSLNYKQ